MELRRSSADKRSTRSLKKRSARSSFGKAVSTTEEDDSNSLAALIMHDILENALEQIHARYMETQTIKLVVHCAHQALIKALKIHFYQHNNYIRDSNRWGSEKRTPPSAPDSWAVGQTPIYKTMIESSELNTLSAIKLDMVSKQGEVITDSTVDSESEPSMGLLDDIRAIVDDVVKNVPIPETEAIEETESTISGFTCVVEGLRHFDEFKMKPQLSKISVDNAAFKLPKIDLPESGSSRRRQSWDQLAEEEKLPPIRSDAKYKCLSSAPDDQIKKPGDKR